MILNDSQGVSLDNVKLVKKRIIGFNGFKNRYLYGFFEEWILFNRSRLIVE